jgi:hypothetical protein
MNIFGIEIGIKEVLIIVGVIVLLYIARPWVRRVLWTLFSGAASVLGFAGRWLVGAAATLYDRYVDMVTAHAADLFERKLVAMEGKLEKRATALEAGTAKAADAIEKTAQTFEISTDNLTQAQPTQTALLQFRQNVATAAPKATTRQINAAVKSFRDAHRANIAPLRSDVRRVKMDVPKMLDGTQRLRGIQGELTRAADKANDAFIGFEKAITTPDRKEIATKHSIVFPLLAAMLLLVVALAGVFLNFFLIQRPMAELVGQGLYIFGVDLPVAAAIVVILLEFVAGVILLESAQITHLLPPFESMHELTRKILFWTSLAFLVMFSIFEASIAIQRDLLITMDERINSMAVGASAQPQGGGITLSTFAQVLLGILIPWLLAIAAIPLETVIQKLWMIAVLAAHQVVAILGFLMHIFSRAVRALGALLMELYDLVIFLPLAIERMIRKFRAPRTAGSPTP